ncbi:MAG: hypothetical protein QOE51_3096 [Actinoplanes sp.]|jgi:hypothetical protein|nr:hypothetical protein [Actinoplanes sp.]
MKKLHYGLATGFAAAFAASVALFAPTAAFAATGCSYVPNQSSKIGFACVTSPTHAYVHDSKADGKGVRVHLWTNISGNKYVVGDPNGSSSGDGTKNLSGGEQFIALQTCAGAGGVDEVCGAKIYV